MEDQSQRESRMATANSGVGTVVDYSRRAISSIGLPVHRAARVVPLAGSTISAVLDARDQNRTSVHTDPELRQVAVGVRGVLGFFTPPPMGLVPAVSTGQRQFADRSAPYVLNGMRSIARGMNQHDDPFSESPWNS